MGMFDVRPVDVDGILAAYQSGQDRRTRQMIAQKEMERADRKEQRDLDFDSALNRYIGSGGIAGSFGTSGRQLEQGAGPNGRTRTGMDARFGGGGVAGAFARPAPSTTPLREVEPNNALAPGLGAESGVTGQEAPSGPESLLPPELRRMANSPNMDERNAAFTEMVRLDPTKAFKIQSDARDAALDRLKGADDALRIAAGRLANAPDDASYQALLVDLDGYLAPLGIDLSKSVPATHPGPQGIRQLQMQALKMADQLQALDREARTDAMIENYEADNARADRNTDSLIADRSERTRVAGQRADTSERREARLGNRTPAKGRAGSSSGGAPKTAINPKTGERLVLRGGKWVADTGGASGNAGGSFR